VLSRKASTGEWVSPPGIEDGLDSDMDDEDSSDDDDTVMSTGNLSTESQVLKVEATLLSSEREIYEGLTEEEKKEFLLKKKAENKKLVIGI
jgi:hypothetical protein